MQADKKYRYAAYSKHRVPPVATLLEAINSGSRRDPLIAVASTRSMRTTSVISRHEEDLPVSADVFGGPDGFADLVE